MTTIALKRPITHEGVTYSSIEADEPTLGAIEAYEKAKAAGATEVGALVALLAVDTGLPQEAVRKMRSSDLARVTEAIAPFVEPTGDIGD